MRRWRKRTAEALALAVLWASPVAAERLFVDEFSGDRLRPEWRVEARDDNRMALIDGNRLLLITAEPSRNRLIADLPEVADFTVNLRGTGEFVNNYSCIQLRIDFREAENALWCTVCGESIWFSKKIRDEIDSMREREGQTKTLDFDIQISRQGFRYRANVALGGRNIELGTHFLPGNEPAAVSIRAYKESGPETAMFIDSIIVEAR